jgi:hypothetical protein
MQIKTNLHYIQFIASAEDSEQQYGKLQIGITHEDFMLLLTANAMQLSYKSLNANETAMTFAHKQTQSLFVMESEEKSWRTTVHYADSNGFLAINEIMHVLSMDAESLLELKASLIHNNYRKCRFTLYPKQEFFETTHQYKLGKNGDSYTSDMDYFIEHEY